MERGVLTAIDANINRTLEGLRVCEDIFRFDVRDRISEEIKSLRHQILDFTQFISSGELLDSRDIEADTQKFIDTPGELKRDNLADIFRSNIRRAAEALRALEEFSKLIAPSTSAGFQKARFDVYNIEKRGCALIEKSYILKRFENSVYAIIDSAFVPFDKVRETAEILALSGAGIIQLRMKNVPDAKFLEYAEYVSSVCRESNVIFIVNDRPDIASISGANGVHVGKSDIPLSKITGICGGRMVKGISALNISEGERALSSAADYIALGPIYSTSSKNGIEIPGIGLEPLRKICLHRVKPVVAIGGITSSNVRKVLDSGCSCIALISELYRDGKIAENTKRMAEIIQNYFHA